MSDLYSIISLSILFYLILLGFVIWFNSRLFKMTKKDRILLSIFEALIAFSFIIITSVNGLISSLVVHLIFVLLFFGLLYFKFDKNSEFRIDFDEKTEVIKNAIVLFNITVLPFMVSMSMLLNLFWVYQILLSIGIVVFVVLLSLVIQKLVSKIQKKLEHKMNLDVVSPYLIVTVFLGIIMAGIILSIIPLQTLPTYDYTLLETNVGVEEIKTTNYEKLSLNDTESIILSDLGAFYVITLSESIITVKYNEEYVIHLINLEEISFDYNQNYQIDFYYQFDGEDLTYMLVQEVDNVFYTETVLLYEVEQTVDDPFYSIFNEFHIIIIGLFMFIPITNVKQYISTIGFVEMTEIKEKESA